MKYVIALVLLASQLAFAGLPPTTSKGSGDSTFKTTFNYDFGSILLSHSGTTVTIGTIPASMLAVAASAPLTLTNGTFGIPVATAGANGYLSSGDFSTFNNKQATINVTAPITLTSGTLVGIPVSTNSVDGYLSGADHTTFSGKQNLLVFSSPLSLSGTTASIKFIAPLTTTNGSLAIPVATGSVDGYLSSADWGTFNSKQATVSATAPIVFSANTVSINKIAPLTTTNGSLAIPAATSSVDGYLAQGDWTTFNNKQATISAVLPIFLSGTAVTLGTVGPGNGGTGLTARVGTGQFLYDNGSAYQAGTIAAGTNITLTNSAGVYTINSTASGGGFTTVASSGTNYTLIIPAATTKVYVWGCGAGGGGGGGGGTNAGAIAGGGGAGGAGAVLFSQVVTVPANGTIAITIGSGGTSGCGGAAGGGGFGCNGGDGGSTTFGTLATFVGGAGGSGGQGNSAGSAVIGGRRNEWRVGAFGGKGASAAGGGANADNENGQDVLSFTGGTLGTPTGGAQGGSGGGGGAGWYGNGGAGGAGGGASSGVAGTSAGANSCAGGGGGGATRNGGAGAIGGVGGSGFINWAY